MKKIALLVIVLSIAACASSKPTTTQAPQPEVKPAATQPAEATPTTNAAPTATTSANNMASADAQATAKLADEIQKINPGENPAEAAKLAAELVQLHKESVYFDYDEYALKPEFKAAIEMQAEHLKNQNTASVVLEGNADERGSAAYNLALGEKRATAVKKALVTLGVPVSKIKVVSFGNTKPKLSCHEEKCWKENRRVDFVIK